MVQGTTSHAINILSKTEKLKLYKAKSSRLQKYTDRKVKKRDEILEIQQFFLSKEFFTNPFMPQVKSVF